MTEMITPLIQRQLDLEIEMQGLGAARVRTKTDTSIERGQGAETLPGSYLVKKTVEPLTIAIKEYLEDANTGRPGPRQVAAKYLEQVKPEVAAYLTVRCALNQCIRGRRKGNMPTLGTRLQSLALAIGNHIEDELRIAVFDQENTGLLRFMEGRLKDQGTTQSHQRSVLFYTMSKAEIEWEGWTRTDKVHLGVKLVELLSNSTGILSIDYGTSERMKGSLMKTSWSVSLTSKVEEWIELQLGRSELMFPFRLPMIANALPWTGVSRGGYLSDSLKTPVVINPSNQHRKLLHSADLSGLYRGLNALQDTAWHVNNPIYEVATTCANNSIEVGELSILEDLPLPEKPLDIATNEEALVDWKKEARDTHLENQRRRSERLRHTSVLNTADRYKDEDEIFFPHKVDFRGRAYPLPVGLQPQGSDFVKSLLHFSRALPLGTPEAARWLAIQGANVWGEDKISLDARVEWVEDNSSMIQRVAMDPYSNTWWTEAEKPWSFLAFCFEWAGYMNKGLDFLSSLPIAMDGSCNGLQHFSAMLRDPIGGRSVNLIPSDLPNDIYKDVADKVTACLKDVIKDSNSDSQQQMWAETWLALGIDRKLTKRPVMVLPYGGTFQSCMAYVREAVDEKIGKLGGNNPFGDSYPKAIGFLSKLVWESIGNVVVAARAAMGWLQAIARIVSKEELPIHWTTPLGFPALQQYKNLKKRRVKTKFNGGVVYFSELEETDTLNKSKQALAISPNFVHSMDAAVMFLTINRVLDEGVASFAMIHDSYGTHAASSDKLARAIRQTFVDMYSGDVLADFREQIAQQLPEEVAETLPPVPDKGTLDLSGVLKSDFFFA